MPSSTTALFDWSSIDLSALTDSIGDALPVVIPVALGIMAIPVVWGIVRKFVKRP